MKRTIIILLVLLTACASPDTPPAPEMITVQHTFSTQAWVPDLYSCASEAGVALSIETRAADFFDPSAQLWIRLGEPDEIPGIAYEIGTDEVVVIAHPDNPIHSLALADIRALFSGEIGNWDELGGEDIPIQILTFSLGEDIRQIFDDVVMQHQPISSQARLAIDIESMVAGIGSDPGAIGFLPRSLVSADVQVLSIKDSPASISIPVLAIPSSAKKTTSNVVACLQSK